MKLLRVRGYSLHETHSMRTPTMQITYYVDLWTQPLHWLLAAWVYHCYDMAICRMPGFRRLDDLILGWKIRRRGGELAIPWSAEQDIRCYRLTRRDQVLLATLEVDKETYEQLAGRTRASPVEKSAGG